MITSPAVVAHCNYWGSSYSVDGTEQTITHKEAMANIRFLAHSKDDIQFLIDVLAMALVDLEDLCDNSYNHEKHCDVYRWDNSLYPREGPRPACNCPLSVYESRKESQ